MNAPVQFCFSRSDRSAEEGEGQFSIFIFCLFEYDRHVLNTGHEHTQ